MLVIFPSKWQRMSCLWFLEQRIVSMNDTVVILWNAKLNCYFGTLTFYDKK